MELEDNFKLKLVDCLSQQVSEIEVLISMYPNAEDIIFTNMKVLDDIKTFISNKTQYTPNHLDFIINLTIEDLKLEISINLPSFYPEEEPDIYVRCNQLNRQQETALNLDLGNFIRSNTFKEQCLFTAITWLQDNIDNYYKKCEDTKTVDSKDKTTCENFTRIWIYSHHIYNKKKREEIVKIAKEYNLTGFSLPGKPGIVCIEGPEYYCMEWWKIIKSMNWKKIVIRKTETFSISEMESETKFKNFEEVHFPNSSKQSKHANMSGLSKYLDDLGLFPAFSDFFGLCNSNT